MSDPSKLCASIAARAVLQHCSRRSLGALVENVPPLDVKEFADELIDGLKKPFRLAVLGSSDGARLKSTSDCEVTYSETKANQWRNDAEATRGKKLVVLVQGGVSKLKSLQSALPVISGDALRPLIRDRAISWLDTQSRRTFWDYLTKSTDQFTVETLISFAALCDGLQERGNRHDLPEYEAKFVYALGLLPDPRLLDCDGSVELARVARANASLVQRIKAPSTSDLRRILSSSEDEDSAQAKTARAVLKFSRTRRRSFLEGLTFNEVASVLASGKQKRPLDDPNNVETVRKERLLGDEAAIDDLLNSGGANLDAIASAFREDDEDPDATAEEVSLEGRVVVRKARTGSSQATALVAPLTSEECFGGIVRSAQAEDYVDCLRLLAAGEARLTKFLPNDESDKNSVRTIIQRATVTYGLTPSVIAAWESYTALRSELLEFKLALVDQPLLLLLSNEKALASAEQLIIAYGSMMDAIREVRDVIRERSYDVAKRLMSKALALDVIFLHFKAGYVAVAGPLHPFHLWRWVQIAQVLKAHAQEFKELGEDLVMRYVANPPVNSPHLLLTSFVDGADRERVFIGLGAIGALPLYGDPESRTAAKFRADGIADIAKRFVKTAPYSVFGFEVVVVDPPGVPDVLEAVLSINGGRVRSDLVPVHIRVFRTRSAPGLTDEEDADLEELTAAIRESRGTVEYEPATLSLAQIAVRLQERPAHYALVFEPGDAKSFRVGVDTSPTLSPFIVPRRYAYDPMEDRFDVIIEGSATPFGAYYDLFRDLLSLPAGNTIGRRSGASEWIPALAELGKHCAWFSIVDQGIEPTLQIPNAMRLDKRSVAGRDVHTFTSHPKSVMRYVEKVIETAGLVPDPSVEERTLRLMRRLGGDTVPLVVSTASSAGMVFPPQARCLVGVLAVTAWYERQSPDALLISLDTEASRTWILGAIDDDARRGDLLCLRHTGSGLHLDVIEVKTREDEQGLYKVMRGGDRPLLEGHAITQIDNTIRILQRILSNGDLTSIDRARKEILRDQFYMAVANRDLSSERRDRSVQLLNQFFEEGPASIAGRLFVVRIESQADPVYPAQPKISGKTASGNPTDIYEILESELAGDSDGGPRRESSAEHSALHASKAERQQQSGTVVAPSVPKAKPREVVEKPATTATEVEGDKRDAKGAFCFQVGQDPTGKSVTWETDKNPNFGLLVTGDSGSGKSQTIRALIRDLRLAGYPVLIFDFKNDYSDPDFTEPLGLKVYDVARKGLPFNPLGLMPDEKGEVQPIRQCHDFASIIARVEGLKEQQHHRLVEAQRKAYENHGLDPRARIDVSSVRSEPVFEEVLDILKANDEEVSNRVLYRLQKFSDLGLFPVSPVGYKFEDLIRDGVVLTLNDASNDKLMRILAEILIVKLHSVIKRGDQPRALRRMLVFDEAWQVAESQRLVDLAREGRAFGVGLLIGTQYPKDLSESLVGCLRTQIYLYNKDSENQKIIVRALCNSTTGPHAQRLMQAVANLGQYQGYLISEQYKQGVRVNVEPYWRRIAVTK